ncbi:MAG: HAD-IA family hydrolase [Myxococcota bacterium]
MRTDIAALLDRYSGCLLDAYGVLVDGRGALPGAAALIERLNSEQRPWMVLTNDASRLPEGCAAHYRSVGLDIPDDRVLTSGTLLEGWFSARGLEGAETLVLGPADTQSYVARAGGLPRHPAEAEDPAVIVAGDTAGFPFLEGLNQALTKGLARLERSLPLHLAVPNPDLLYPVRSGERDRPGEFGLAAGSMASVLEEAFTRRFPEAPRFEPLGKPEPHIFAAARARLGTDDLVMVGDQRATDIAGAKAAGLDAALVTSGVSGLNGHPQPTWVLEGLS